MEVPLQMRRARSRSIEANQRVLEEHLAESGLDPITAARLRIEHVEANADPVCRVPVPSLRIPYFDLDGNERAFCRYRLIVEWVPEGETKPRRYTQPAGVGSQLYMPPIASRSWRLIAQDPSARVFITEGEKKAACGCLNGFDTIGIGGVWNWQSQGAAIPDVDHFSWKGRTVYLVFDSPDVDKNEQVRDAIEQLGIYLRSQGALVRFVTLPYLHDEKVGLDDYLVSNGAQALEDLLRDAPNYVDTVAELNRVHAAVWLGAKAYVMREHQTTSGAPAVSFAKPNELRPMYVNRSVTVPTPSGDKRVNAFDLWQKSSRRRTYEGIAFEPGRNIGNMYNLWRGFSVKPSTTGDCSRYLAHVKDNICSGSDVLYDYVLAWMAHTVQHPGELVGTALVLRGRQGTGKGVFANLFGALFGPHYLHLSDQRHLTGNFNAHSMNRLVLFADEAFWAGDKSAGGTLKAIITEPTRIIEQKGKDAFEVSNYARLIMASNEDWVVPAELEERRFVVIDVGSKRREDIEYFKLLTEQMRDGGLEALLHHLMNVDISKVNLRIIPRTSALLDTKLLSLNPVRRFWHDMLVRGCNVRGGWADEVLCAELHQQYCETVSVMGTSRRASQTELGMALRKMVPGLQTKKRRRPELGGAQASVWVFPPLENCRDEFEVLMDQEILWEVAESDQPKELKAVLGVWNREDRGNRGNLK